jgi:hypothetical protein
MRATMPPRFARQLLAVVVWCRAELERQADHGAAGPVAGAGRYHGQAHDRLHLDDPAVVVYGNSFMQLADTYAAARRAGRGGAPGLDDPYRRRSGHWVGPVPQVGGRGVDDASCRARCRPSGRAPGTSADDQQPVEATGADRADPPPREGVRVGRLHRRVHYLGVL